MRSEREIFPVSPFQLEVGDDNILTTLNLKHSQRHTFNKIFNYIPECI